jgi:hypothetical protein
VIAASVVPLEACRTGDARAYDAEMAAAEKALREQMLATMATLPPPPCR